MAKKMLKRNLLTSLVATALSASMLVGTTFAWFTDSVTSTNNVIKTGNLDVELYYQSKETTDWTPVGEDTNVFMKNALWEPGHTEVVKLKVANEGTLALKYQLGVNVASETVSKNVKGEELKLSDYIEYGIMLGDYDYTRAEAINAVKGLSQPLSQPFATEQKLLAFDGNVSTADEKVVTMVVYMPEEVGNEANYKGAVVPQINLGINVFATQVAQESDSFGNNYDEYYSTAYTVAQANELLKGSGDVMLIGTQEVNAVLQVPAAFNKKLTVMNSTVRAINAEGDLNLELYGDVFVNAKGNARTIDEVSSAISVNGKLTISGDATLTAIAADVNGGFGIGGMNATSVAITGITIDYVSGAYAYQAGTDTKYYKDAPEGSAAIGSGYDGAVITLNDVTVTKAIGGSKAAGIGARYHTGVTVNVENSVIEYVEGGVSAAGIGGSRVSNGATEDGTTINITDSTITAKGGAYGAGIGSGYDTHCQAEQPLCTIVITGSTINATGGKYAAGVGTGYHHAALAGEIKNSIVNAVSGEKFYKATYTAAMDIGFGVVDPAREGQQTDSKLIVNGEEITLDSAPYAMNTNEDLTNAVASGKKNIVLMAGAYTLPATSGDVTISGVKEAVISIDKPVAENITLKGVTVLGMGLYTGIQHSNKVVYENCVIKGIHFLYANEVLFKNCVVDLTEVVDYIWTYSAANVTFDGCTFNTNGKAILIYKEGIDFVTNVTVKNCTFNATESALASGNVAAAIEIDSSLATNGHYTLTTANNVVDDDFSGEWRIKKSGKDNTTVNGVVYNAITIDGRKAIYTSDDLVKAINEAKAGDTIYLGKGDYSLRFTNNTDFNVDGLTVVGVEGTNLAISSSEAWYGRIQGNEVTFKNIRFTTSVGATGKATYNNCTFEDWTICASSGNANTYFNDCVINGCLNTSTDFSSGDTYVKNCKIVKAEFSGSATMNFVDCEIGELISWDMKTVLTNCTVTKLDKSHMDKNEIIGG